MPKQEAVVIPIPSEILERMQVLIGDEGKISNSPTTIFNSERIEFLSELSRRLFAHQDARFLPDVMSYAYWIRYANLRRLAESHTKSDRLEMGVGLSFHICPANVPINFAFSMAFGLLAGNTCVIRLPTKNSSTLDVLIKVISDILMEKKYCSLLGELMLLRFDRNDEITRFWMSISDARIIWGGDATVKYMRGIPSRPRSREISFPDRYSISAINPGAILELSDDALREISQSFYNDLYLMDQSACSSPQLLIWIGEEDLVCKAKARLWSGLAHLTELRYAPKPIQIMDKYVQACRLALANNQIIKIDRHKNQIYRIELSGLSEQQDEYRGYFGMIHEVTLESFEPIASIVNEKYQTLTYFGLDPKIIRDFITKYRLRGIDRIVPIGKALDMDIYWDGYEIISALSRSIIIN